MSIAAGSVIGLVAAAGIAFGITVLGGNITGTIQSNGNQPAVQWVDSADSTATAPQWVNCSIDHVADSSASGSATLTPDKDGVEQDLNISLSNVWAGEVCTFQGYLAESDGNTNNSVTVSGINLSATFSSSSTPEVLTTEMDPGSLTLTNGAGATAVTFTVTVPSDPDGGTYSVSGGLDLSNVTSGENTAQNGGSGAGTTN